MSWLKDNFGVIDPEDQKAKKKKSDTISFDVDPGQVPAAPPVEDTTKFPASAVATPTIKGATNCEPHMEKVLEMYEKGFESLNQPGVEFFEYFKSVVSAGIANPSAYEMAFKMLSGMESTMTKKTLISQSQFYLNEIDKVHKKFDQDGETKRTTLENNKDAERNKLASDIDLLKQQLQSIQNQIDSKSLSLNSIDETWNPQIEDIECKMAANTQARNTIKGTINRVVDGIKQNLK